MVFKHSVIVIFLAVIWINIAGKETGYENGNSSETRAIKKEACTCVPFSDCSRENTVEGRGNFTNKSKCRDNFKVCCKISSIKKGNRLANKPHKCGYYNKSGTFPWSGKLYYLEKKQGRLVYTYKCEFSLIHQQVGLTAAHCLDDEYYLQPEKYIINIGNVEGLSLFRSISEIIIHPQFSSRNLQNDIALLFFMDPIRLRTLRLICIPPPRIHIFNYKNCLVSTKRNSHIMMNVSIVPKQSCLEMLSKTTSEDTNGTSYKLHKSFVCADGDNMDICNGDCGGALVCPILGQKQRFQLVGIAAREIDCKENMPELYVHVKKFREWIDTEFDIRGLHNDVYRY